MSESEAAHSNFERFFRLMLDKIVRDVPDYATQSERNREALF